MTDCQIVIRSSKILFVCMQASLSQAGQARVNVV